MSLPAATALPEISPVVEALLREGSCLLTGHRRRAFQGRVADALLGGSARGAETRFGWNRHSVEQGRAENRAGIVCADDAFRARGNRPAEVKLPKLAADVRALADACSQANPRLRGTLSYTRLGAASLRRALVAEKGWDEREVPAERTLKRDAQPPGLPPAGGGQAPARKKTPECDAIFANVAGANAAADASGGKCLRLSVDTKATVVLGDYSRRGRARGLKAVAALDHDMAKGKEKLIPIGILEVKGGDLDLAFSTSPAKTADLVGDCLQSWWRRHRHLHPGVEELVLNLDNG